MSKPYVLGFSASLRHARSLEGSKELVEDLANLKDEKALQNYLLDKGCLHLEQYFQAGRERGVAHDVLYKELRRLNGKHGLSNSEVCVAAGLWGAFQEGAEIEYIPLGDFFLPDGTQRCMEDLRQSLLEAAGILISTPVYFGDRSSLSQSLIEMIRRDESLRKSLKGRIYAGLAVGAKRNGGQETTLAYQLHDMLDLGFLGVGNGFQTTSQYGGTGHAGDVGTMPKDLYGLETCIDTGRRVARVTSFISASEGYELKDKPRTLLLVLQDRNDEASRILEPFATRLSDLAEVSLLPVHRSKILPCLACDVCPSRVGSDDDYRCIQGQADDFWLLHTELIGADVIIPIMLSCRDHRALSSVYQNFMERTRYLRRGDYAISDRLIVPLVLNEIESYENLHMRMTTSLIRHQTVLQRPILGWLHDGKLLNAVDIDSSLTDAAVNGTKLTCGRLATICDGNNVAFYEPVGYVLSTAKDKTSYAMAKRRKMIDLRHQELMDQSRHRLTEVDHDIDDRLYGKRHLRGI